MKLTYLRKFAVLPMLSLFLFAESNADHHEANEAVPLPKVRQVSESGIRHSFLVTGSKMTAIFDEESKVIWSVKGGSRDGTVLPDGNILICESRRVVEYAEGSTDIVWSYHLDSKKNKEIAAAWRLDDGNTLIVENGGWPRLMEITKEGQVSVEFPLQPETDNAHMQTRMARKLPNGNYLVPHLLAFSVKEYTATGEVVNIIKTDLEELGGREQRNWPFTAIRKDDGSTLVNLTNGNKTVVFGSDGEVLWKCDNSDVDGRFADPCGAHLLPNGNVVIGSYGQKDRSKPIYFEVTPEKEVVWEFYHPKAKSHEVHVLTTNGTALKSYTK
ncbi:MAG: beta-propeller domain-containing protein [Opitutaceae bacterium]